MSLNVKLQKYIPFTITIISILILSLISPVLYGFLLNPGFGTTNEPASKITKITPVAYTIFQDGSTYYARNGATGEIDYSRTNAGVVVQAALDSLTIDRTRKEKIVLQGVLLFSASESVPWCGVNVPSYTIIEIQGRILQDADNIDLFEIGAGVSNVEIYGGMMEGRYSGQTIGAGIGMWGEEGNLARNITIHDIHFKNAMAGVFIASYVQNVDIHNIIFEDVLYGVAVGGYLWGCTTFQTKGISISNIKSYGANNNWWAINIDRYVQDVTINNVVANQGGAVALASVKNVVVNNATALNLTTDEYAAFNIETTPTYPGLENVTFSNSWVINSTNMQGWVINGGDPTNKLKNVRLVNSGAIRSNPNALELHGNVANISLDGFQAIESSTNGIIIYSDKNGNPTQVYIRKSLILNNGINAAWSSNGIQLVGAVSYFVITESIIGDNRTYVNKTQTNGLAMENTVSYGTITDNDFRGNLLYGAIINGSYHTVMNNDFRENMYPIGATIQGYNHVVKNNLGFATENNGTAIISSSDHVSFSHLLAGTPTTAHASFNSTAVAGWTWTATSTQITITVTPSGTYAVHWKVEYAP